MSKIVHRVAVRIRGSGCVNKGHQTNYSQSGGVYSHSVLVYICTTTRRPGF